MECENTFAHPISEKALISRTCEECLQFNNNSSKTQMIGFLKKAKRGVDISAKMITNGE